MLDYLPEENQDYILIHRCLQQIVACELLRRHPP